MSTTTTTAVRERPILFKPEMVRSILDGRKTMTRRIVKPQPPYMFSEGDVAAITSGSRWAFSRMYSPTRGVAWPPGIEPGIRCPYGVHGDKLWCRETWQPATNGDTKQTVAIYQADWAANGCPEGPDGGRWRPSIHMPRWASRLTLEVTGVRVERLQDITEDAAIAEGVEGWEDKGFDDAQDYWRNYLGPEDQSMDFKGDPISSFCTLWDSINGHGAWDVNPWVWVVSFKRIES